VERARLAGFRRVESRDKGNGYEIRSGPAGSTQPIRAFTLLDGTLLLQAEVLNRTDDGDVQTYQWRRPTKSPEWRGPTRAPYRLFGLSQNQAFVQYLNEEMTVGIVRLSTADVSKPGD
jgi:hypothetical protein